MLIEQNKISIIIPVYNANRSLEKCVLSVKRQKYDNIEILLIDDGSSDGSERLCDFLAEQDERIKVYHKDNGGVSSARNLGIERAAGDYICFVDSDDYVEDDYVSELLANMHISSLSVCGVDKNGITHEQIIESVKKLSLDEARASVLSTFNEDILGYPVNKMFDLHLIKRHNIRFCETITMCEDILFCLNYLYYAYGEISVSSKQNYHYVMSSQGATGSQYVKQNKFNKKRLSEVLALLKCRKYIKKSEQVKLAWQFRFLQTSGNVLRVLISNDVKQQYSLLYKTLLRYVRRNLYFGLTYQHGRMLVKLSIILLAVSPRLEYTFWRCWKRIR